MIENSNVRYGSVCSGIEAATVAWHGLGWTPTWFSEIEPFPCQVLQHHYPQVINLGDMLGVEALIRSGAAEAPDVLVAGTPCTSFSVAGLRQSLNDPRGQLTQTYVRILNAIDVVRSRSGKAPATCVWENVPGVLNVRDNAFGCLLGALVGSDVALLPPGNKWPCAGVVSGPQRTAVYRILDAQFFGTPQRRKRIFVVSSARASIGELAAVLLECEGAGGDTADGGEARQEVAPATGTGAKRVAPALMSAVVAPTTVDFGRTADRIYLDADKSVTLSSQGGGMGAKTGLYAFAPDYIVRRLTPVECERLQGFPDLYTCIPTSKGKFASDGPRYRALGNSMAVPVMVWIGRRMVKYLGL